MERGQITFYRSFYDAVNSLPKKDRLPVYEAIFAYGLDEIEPKLSGVQLAVFTLVKPTLDTSRRKAKNGLLGGSAKANGKQSGSKAEANRKQTASKTEANQKQTVSEKENEIEKEIEIEIEKESYIAPSDSHSEPEFISLPLNDKTSFSVTETMVSDYSELYPAVDVKQEFRKMLGWCKANPTKLKTRKGIPRFINSWLAREQDKGGASAPGKSYGKQAVPYGSDGLGDAELEAIKRMMEGPADG